MRELYLVVIDLAFLTVDAEKTPVLGEQNPPKVKR
jgi:hypothetical protein